MTSTNPQTRQDPYLVRTEWGLDGLHAIGPACGVLIIVDVLSFSTAVDVATAAGAGVLPLRWRDERAQHAADEAGAVLAAPHSTSKWSLSPSSLRSLDADVLLALPSPNGATLCAEAADLCATVFVGCLRNASAVAAAASRAADGRPVGVISAGERWGITEGPLRVSVEDLLGAGAIISALSGDSSPEADLAATGYRALAGQAGAVLTNCSSGRELTELGFAQDVALAAEIDSSATTPILRCGVLEPR